MEEFLRGFLLEIKQFMAVQYQQLSLQITQFRLEMQQFRREMQNGPRNEPLPLQEKQLNEQLDCFSQAFFTKFCEVLGLPRQGPQPEQRQEPVPTRVSYKTKRPAPTSLSLSGLSKPEEVAKNKTIVKKQGKESNVEDQQEEGNEPIDKERMEVVKDLSGGQVQPSRKRALKKEKTTAKITYRIVGHSDKQGLIHYSVEVRVEGSKKVSNFDAQDSWFCERNMGDMLQEYRKAVSGMDDAGKYNAVKSIISHRRGNEGVFYRVKWNELDHDVWDTEESEESLKKMKVLEEYKRMVAEKQE